MSLQQRLRLPSITVKEVQPVDVLRAVGKSLKWLEESGANSQGIGLVRAGRGEVLNQGRGLVWEVSRVVLSCAANADRRRYVGYRLDVGEKAVRESVRVAVSRLKGLKGAWLWGREVRWGYCVYLRFPA